MNLPFLEPFNLISTRISVRCCLLSLLSQCGEHIPMQISLLSLTDEELHAKLDYLGRKVTYLCAMRDQLKLLLFTISL
jgi:hypothetical protein